MCAKEEDAKKNIESKKDRQTKRQLSIAIRTQAAEENRNRSLGRSTCIIYDAVFNLKYR